MLMYPTSLVLLLEMWIGKRTTLLFILIVLLALLLIVAIFFVFPPRDRLSSAAGYLKSHFNSEVGLVYESEDPGDRTYGNQTYSYNQIYWLYSDNLLVSWALKPYDSEMSDTINQTIRSYSVGESGLFEVIFGKIISQNVSAANQLIIANNSEHVIMAEFHNSSTPLLWEKYGDTLIYQSLNEYLKGNKAAAEKYFIIACQMFDGKGVNDTATKTDGKYANYKLALLIYASKVLNNPKQLNANISCGVSVKETLWSMQNTTTGGITSLADPDGNPMGSANAETTSMTLLAYNDELIARMHSLFASNKQDK